MNRILTTTLSGVCTLITTSFALAQGTDPDSPIQVHRVVLPSPARHEIAVEDTEPDIRGLLISRNEGVMNSLMTARVHKLYVKTGDRVSAGQPLVSFDCADLSARIRSATARLKQHRLILEANRELAKEQAVARLDLLMAEAKVEEGEADLQSAEAQRARCKVTAPYAAVITDVMIARDESVQIGDPLVEIMDDRSLDMVVHIPSAWINRNLVGKQFAVRIDETGNTYQAEVARITPKIDATSGTVEVTARVLGKNPELLPGMSGAANFPNF